MVDQLAYLRLLSLREGLLPSQQDTMIVLLTTLMLNHCHLLLDVHLVLLL